MAVVMEFVAMWKGKHYQCIRSSQFGLLNSIKYIVKRWHFDHFSQAISIRTPELHVRSWLFRPLFLSCKSSSTVWDITSYSKIG